jgi:hypothetical protein
MNDDRNWLCWVFLFFLIDLILDSFSIHEIPGLILLILLYFKTLFADLAEVVIFL